MASRNQILGAGAVAAAAMIAVYMGVVTPTQQTQTFACIPFQGEPPPDLKTTRFHAVSMSPSSMKLLGFPEQEEYVAADVRALDADSNDLSPLIGNADELGEVEDVTPLHPECQVAIYRLDDPQYPAKCACSAGTDCEMSQMDEQGALSWVPAPKNLTISPNSWRGAGCKRKPCVELAGTDSMPTACK